MQNRFTSRKFILSLAAQVAAIGVLLWPEHEQPIVEAARGLAALLTLLLAALGYVKIEGEIDRKRQEGKGIAQPGG